MIHNPENVASAGEGYRFLTVEENRRFRKPSSHIEAFINGSWCGMFKWNGRLTSVTYRTKLTPEELEAEG